MTVEPSPRMAFLVGELAHHPRKKFEFKNPIGTPFACADLASVMMMMKQFYPEITIEEIKEILLETAGEADGVPEFIDYLQTGLTCLSYGLYRSKEKLKQNMDPINMSRFILQLEEGINEVIDDPIKASVIAHEVGDLNLSFKKKLLGTNKSPNNKKLKRLTIEQETWESITPADLEKVTQVIRSVVSNFTLDDVAPGDIVDARTERKGSKTVRRRAAVYEAIRRVKEKQGVVPVIEEQK